MNLQIQPAHELTTYSPAETNQLGKTLGSAIQSGDVLCLSGELGAGKTHFTQGLAAGWEALEHATSPTFTVINEYTRVSDDQRFFHVDCYRLSGNLDALSTGIVDIFDSEGVVAIEWAERIRELIPEDRLWITIARVAASTRTITFQPSGPRGETLLEALRTANL